LSHFWGTYAFDLWLVEKLVVDFLFVTIDFSLPLTLETW